LLDKLRRYVWLARLIEDSDSPSILEVGAGPHGLGCCLPYHFVGVDTSYPEKPVPTQQAVKASATRLPFPDRTFDLVLCIEVLEHLPIDERPEVVEELCRVARDKIVITHPSGTLARLCDHLLAFLSDALRFLGKTKPPWLVEHLQNPYPDPRGYLAGQAADLSVRAHGQENALLHPAIVFLSTLDCATRPLRKSYTLWPKLTAGALRLLSFPPYYRRIITLTRRPNRGVS